MPYRANMKMKHHIVYKIPSALPSSRLSFLIFQVPLLFRLLPKAIANKFIFQWPPFLLFYCAATVNTFMSYTLWTPSARFHAFRWRRKKVFCFSVNKGELRLLRTLPLFIYEAHTCSHWVPTVSSVNTGYNKTATVCNQSYTFQSITLLPLLVVRSNENGHEQGKATNRWAGP